MAATMRCHIEADPFERYIKKRTFMKTKLRTKLLVVRKEQPTQRYSMVIAPTVVDGKPNAVLQEVTKLVKLSHSHLINVFEVYLYEEKCYWIMEDWTSGRKSNGLSHMDENEVKEMMHRFVSAIKYMHTQDVVVSVFFFSSLELRKRNSIHTLFISTAVSALTRSTSSEKQVV